MVKLENSNFPTPDFPPGFEPLNPKTRSATATATNASPSTSSGGTITTAAAGGADQNGGVLQQGQSPDSSTEIRRRRTQRKRHHPSLYVPPAPPVAVTTPRRRGRPHKVKSAPAAGRRGRPQKAKSMSLFALQEAEQRESTNDTQSAPRTRSQGRDPLPYFMQPVQLIPGQPSSQANTHVGEQVPQINTSSSSPADPAVHDAPMAGITCEVNLSNYFLPQETEQPVTIPRGGRSKGYSDQGFNQKTLHRFLNDVRSFRQSSAEKNIVSTLKAIGKKHGDITKSCTLQSDQIKNLILIGICNVVQDLQRKRLEDLDAGSLDSYFSTVRDAESMRLDVQWLRNRLDELKNAVVLTSETKGLQSERKALLVDIDQKKKELLLRSIELDRLKAEVRDIEEQVARGDVMLEELNKRYSDHMARMSRFPFMNLMDGLI